MQRDTPQSIARKSVLAALGAITLADDELAAIIDRLAARGEELRRARVTAAESALKDGAREGRILTKVLREELEKQQRWLAEVLSLPTREMLEQLHTQVDRLLVEVEELHARQARPAAPATPVAVPATNGMPEPLPGYELLNAKQAAAAVATLDAVTLQAVRSYELAHRNRVTVLRAIDEQLAPAS